MLLQMLLERVVLLASAKVRDVGDDQPVFPGQQFGCFDHACGGDCAFAGGVVQCSRHAPRDEPLWATP